MSPLFLSQRQFLAGMLLQQTPIHTGEWHSVDVSKSSAHATYELLNESFRYHVPSKVNDVQAEIKPNLPWAENHFMERVSGDPLNPPPSHEDWPFGNTRRHIHEDKHAFSHTYPERFWPRWANATGHPYQNMFAYKADPGGHMGIRFRYGDLADLVELLATKPLTRQAYLPVWFPEDTGAHHGERVPCSLGYHFIIRNNQLHCVYSMRSCEFVRHFQDDVYMAARLVQWIAGELNSKWETDTYYPMDSLVSTGRLSVHITSLHALVGDRAKLEAILSGTA